MQRHIKWLVSAKMQIVRIIAATITVNLFKQESAFYFCFIS